MLKSTLEHSSHGRGHEEHASAEEKTDRLEDPTEIFMARQLDPLKVTDPGCHRLLKYTMSSIHKSLSGLSSPRNT